MEKPSSSKINPLIKQPSRETELVGGIKNALERGEPMPKIKKSFINAGYNQQEVSAAVQKLSSQPTPTQSSAPQQVPQEKKSFFSRLFKKKIQPTSQQPSQSTPQPSPRSISQLTPTPILQAQKKPKQRSKLLIIIMIIISSLILIGAAIFGLYWDKIF